MEAIAKVDAPPELKFSTDRDFVDWVNEHVCQRIMALVKVTWGLGIRVVDIEQRVSNCRARLLTPVMVEKTYRAEHRQWDAQNRSRKTAGIVFHPDVDGGVIHIILYALPIDNGQS